MLYSVIYDTDQEPIRKEFIEVKGAEKHFFHRQLDFFILFYFLPPACYYKE